MRDPLDIFLVCVPGLESALAEEIAALGLRGAKAVHGGVEMQGNWQGVWRMNLWLRGATRILVRLGSFKARNMGELESKGADFPWSEHLMPREPVRLDVTCRKSRISNARAAEERLGRALRVARVPVAEKALVTLKVRIEKDIVTVSADTSGEPLYKRGHKVAVGKAPLRESMAALILRRAGFQPGEPVLDPTCGSGTIPLEAADIASGRAPGRDRTFAFERLGSFNGAAFKLLPRSTDAMPSLAFGFDRDDGAIRNAAANARRAGLDVTFKRQPVGALTAPDGSAGLVICNPPYGTRIGDDRALLALYGTLGQRLSAGFSGWRVAILTSDAKLAHATGLDFDDPGGPIAHGGLKVWLFQARL